MKDNYKEITVEHLEDELDAWKRMYKDLKKENAKLKDRILTDENFEEKLDKENKGLITEAWVYKSQMEAYRKKYLALLEANTELDEENRKLRDGVKGLVGRNMELDKKYMHVLNENKKLKELQIYWKTVAERIEEDKKVARE